MHSWQFIEYAWFNFDNIGTGALQTFRVIMLEGWSGVMYMYLDSSGPLATIFFPIIVVFGAFFLLELFLAVIMETFSETSKRL